MNEDTRSRKMNLKQVHILVALVALDPFKRILLKMNISETRTMNKSVGKHYEAKECNDLKERTSEMFNLP